MTLVEELHETGIRRVGSPGRGFRYLGAARSDAERARELRIPPAWTEVAVARSPKARLQAVGKDKAGRWQYRYHPSAVREREERKFRRLLHFARALPAMRRVLERDLRKQGLPREKVMACILRILSTCFMRPGSQVYAKENGSYGIATLRTKHVEVQGDTVRFDYTGKSKQRQVRELRDRRVARIVRDLLALPGREVFKYVAEDGSVVNIRRRSINAYIKEVMGERFSAKDFRTWAGTLICACVLARMHAAQAQEAGDRKRLAAAAVKETASHLGNTPAVCKTSYIWPSVITSFQQGRVMSEYFETVDELVSCTTSGRHAACEAALVELLHEGPAIAQAVTRAPARRGPPEKLSRRRRRGVPARASATPRAAPRKAAGRRVLH